MNLAEKSDRLIHEYMHAHRDKSRKFFQKCGLYSGHPFMLFQIAKHPGITQKELAEILCVAPASIAVSAKRMESAGLIKRVTDEADKRVVHLHLTCEGKNLDNACKKGKESLVIQQFQGFSDEELSIFCDMLERMIQNIENTNDELEGGIES